MAFYDLFMTGIIEQLKLIKGAKYLCAGLFTSQFKQTLRTIRTEPSVKSIVPHVLNYLLWLSKDRTFDPEDELECQFCVLTTLHQVLLNPFLEIDQHLHIIMILIMTVLLSTYDYTTDLPNIVHIKTYAGKMLGLICKRYEQKYISVVTNSLHLVSKVIEDENSHVDSLYGAIQGVFWLGGKVTEQILLKYIDKLYTRLTTIDKKQIVAASLSGQCVTSLIVRLALT